MYCLTLRRKGVWPLATLITALLLTQDRASGQSLETRGSESNVSTLVADTAASRVYIFVGKTGFGHDHGVEGRLRSGRLIPGANGDAGELVFDMTTFDADTPAARRFVRLSETTDPSTRRQVNANMRGPAVLDVRRYPTARFEIQSARSVNRKSRTGQPLYELKGRFTLHGVARPLQLIATMNEEPSGRVRLRGNFRILQTSFGIKPFSKAFGAVGVTDALTIYGDIVLTPKSRSAPAAAVTRGSRQRRIER